MGSNASMWLGLEGSFNTVEWWCGGNAADWQCLHCWRWRGRASSTTWGNCASKSVNVTEQSPRKIQAALIMTFVRDGNLGTRDCRGGGPARDLHPVWKYELRRYPSLGRYEPPSQKWPLAIPVQLKCRLSTAKDRTFGPGWNEPLADLRL